MDKNQATIGKWKILRGNLHEKKNQKDVGDLAWRNDGIIYDDRMWPGIR